MRHSAQQNVYIGRLEAKVCDYGNALRRFDGRVKELEYDCEDLRCELSERQREIARLKQRCWDTEKSKEVLKTATDKQLGEFDGCEPSGMERKRTE